ncbi:MAG: hypothetical protein LBK61_14095 [Spirochaetaceae bacterium]|jgi:hypothetical protein|nr:hypothetical protein [Spirochaetaceae bacterium]
MIYEPRVTREGDTTVLTYDVKADFSVWDDDDDDTGSGIIYKGQTPGKAKPQSIEALLLHYGKTATGLFGEEITTIATDKDYELNKGEGDDPLPHYVIIPLDKFGEFEPYRVSEYLLKKYTVAIAAVVEDAPDSDPYPKFPLVWIEENPAIGEVEQINTTDSANWKKGTYENIGYRISGLVENIKEEVVFAGNINNFEDGGIISEEEDETATRLSSIATVLADGTSKEGRYTSTLNFYAGAPAIAILANLKDDGEWKSAQTLEKIKVWMKSNKPALRVVYRWVD